MSEASQSDVSSEGDMWSLLLYCLAVVLGLLLIWFYEPKDEATKVRKKDKRLIQPIIFHLNL